MTALSSSQASMIAFPSSGQDLLPSASVDALQNRSTYLPFRRISLPSAPSLQLQQNRLSIASLASFDSLPEEGPPRAPPATPAVIRNAVRAPKLRPSSVDMHRRAVRRKESRMVDGQREGKRRKVITEFYETEKSYLDGLELIHSHFLTPIIASLDTPQPLLTRSELTSVFSNFIDIWNLHRSFYASLTNFLNASASRHQDEPMPPLSPVLLPHFPYLSLYTPFVSSFSDALASYAGLVRNNSAFAAFISVQEADPRCGKLKFRDWLLTIVQRCPRYLLLLKDLIGCTDSEDPEYASLTAVHTLVSKITLSLNTSLHTHAQTLSLLALQRNTVNLPFQLITPGRTFLKRAPLLQLEGSTPKEREFLLFSDCLIWLASADGDHFSDKWAALASPPPSASTSSFPDLPRSRTRSDADTDIARRRQSLLQLSRLNGSPRKKRQASSGVDERWVYRGHVELVDLEVVVSTSQTGAEAQEHALELLSPHQSFAVYGVNREERDEWVAAIRNAKSSLLVSLSVMQLNSTLTSSASTQHLRRTLQALPYAPDDESKPRRGKVEHFVPAVWVPDGKTESCMRCGRTFGWRRRRHHCRLCGRCVCGGCSSKTFFIVDGESDKGSKSARACESCYDTVFPLLEQPMDPHVVVTAGTVHSHFTLSGLKSMPCLLLNDDNDPAASSARHGASALMSIDLPTTPKRPLTRIYDESPPDEPYSPPPQQGEGSPVAAVRVRPAAPRPKSYVQILEEFQERAAGSPQPTSSSPTPSPRASRFSRHSTLDETHCVPDERDEDLLSLADAGAGASGGSSGSPTPTPTPAPTPALRDRREDTARRHKRFSLPAVALQTNPVTARPAGADGKGAHRFSLALGKGGGVAQARGPHAPKPAKEEKRHSIAMGRLTEILARGKE